MVRILGGCDSGRQVILKVDAILAVGIMDRCVLTLLTSMQNLGS